MKRTMAMKRRSNYTWIIRLIAALAVVIAACTQMGMVCIWKYPHRDGGADCDGKSRNHFVVIL